MPAGPLICNDYYSASARVRFREISPALIITLPNYSFDSPARMQEVVDARKCQTISHLVARKFPDALLIATTILYILQ